MSSDGNVKGNSGKSHESVRWFVTIQMRQTFTEGKTFPSVHGSIMSFRLGKKYI